jgi:TetR/AcrR family transcriptional regulator
MAAKTSVTTAAAADRRSLILERAERLFADHGYEGTALSEIARAAGLGNAGLIHYFPSKAAIYREVLERLATDLEERVARALEGKRDPGARLRAFVGAGVAWNSERPLAVRVLMREVLDNRERLETAIVLPLARFVETGLSIIKEAQAAGVIAAGPPEAALTLIIGTLNYSAIVRPSFNRVLKTRLLGNEKAWLEAVGDAVLKALVKK